MKSLLTFSALFVASLLLTSSFAGPAKASLKWEFGFFDSVNDFFGTGTFELSGPTGNDPDDLVAFEFSGTCGQDTVGLATNDCDFALTDIDAVFWELRPDWTFVELVIEAEVGLDNPVLALLVVDESFVELGCIALSGLRCNGQSTDLRTVAVGGGAFLNPIHETPEPPALWLFSLGLALLFVMALWTRSATGSRRPLDLTFAGGARPSPNPTTA